MLLCLFFVVSTFPGSVLLLVWYLQNYLLYMPFLPKGSRGPPSVTPADLGLPYQDVWVTAADGVKIHCWLVQQPEPQKAATMIAFHGNAGNLSLRVASFEKLYTDLQVNLLCVSYRGYGWSDGTPSERGLKKDAQAALEWLLTSGTVDPHRIVAFGQSLGGAVASHLAERNQDTIKALIIENTFVGISEMIEILYRPLRYIKWLSCNSWRNVDIMPKLRIPILFLASTHDEIVPHHMMLTLHSKATNSSHTDLAIFAESMHNNCVEHPQYSHRIRSFLATVRV